MIGLDTPLSVTIKAALLALAPLADEGNMIAVRSLEDAMGLLDSGETECVYDAASQVLVYVGETGTESVDCFQKYRDADVRSLRVTSNGGWVKPAITGARIIREEKWAVEAFGVCASSCMNYWAPASSAFSSAPGTKLIVHGKPPRRLISFFVEEDYRQHHRFARELKLHDDWFGTTLDAGGKISSRIGTPAAPNLLVGPCHAQMIAHVVPVKVWWPSSMRELEEFVDGSHVELRVKECELDGLTE